MSPRQPLSPDVVDLELPPVTFEYEERDVMLYALAVGATELEFVYERNLKVLPTFAVIPAFPILMGLASSVEVNVAMILHGEQAIVLYRPIPVRGRLVTTGRVAALYDKGKGALLVLEAESHDEGGEPLFLNRFGIFVRGAGGFGGERGPSAGNLPPQRPPDRTVVTQTLPIQAMLYRLCGDRNPLHIDPAFARAAGYERPILHGLCTFGHVGRAVLAEYCGNDPSRLSGLAVRFSGVVYPGDQIITDMWDEGGGRIILQARTQEGSVAISNAAAQVR